MFCYFSFTFVSNQIHVLIKILKIKVYIYFYVVLGFFFAVLPVNVETMHHCVASLLAPGTYLHYSVGRLLKDLTRRLVCTSNGADQDAYGCIEILRQVEILYDKKYVDYHSYKFTQCGVAHLFIERMTGNRNKKKIINFRVYSSFTVVINSTTYPDNSYNGLRIEQPTRILRFIQFFRRLVNKRIWKNINYLSKMNCNNTFYIEK